MLVTLTALVARTRPVRPTSEVTIIAAGLVIQVAATAIGVACGTLLHRPIVRQFGAMLVGSTGALVVLVVLPPTQHEIRQLDEGHTGGLAGYAAVAIAIGITAVVSASYVADRRS